VSTSSSAFPLLQTQSQPTPTPQPAQPPAAPRLTSYTAYAKNELKITLTPQTSASRPGVVNIMARFQVTGSNAASGLNFQAAVPKVNRFFQCAFLSQCIDTPLVPAAADAADVESRRSTQRDGVTTDACNCPTRCKPLLCPISLAP